MVQAFEELDSDGNGTLSSREFTDGLLVRLNKTASWSLRRPLLTALVHACWLHSGASRSLERPEAHDRRKGGSKCGSFLFSQTLDITLTSAQMDVLLHVFDRDGDGQY